MKNTAEEKERKATVRGEGLPLTANIGFLVGGSILVAVLLAIYFFNWRNGYLYNSEVRNNIIMVGETAGSQIVGPLSVSDHDTVASIMSGIVSVNEQIADCLIVMKDDMIVFYDIDGDRENKKYSDKMRKPGLDYISIPIILETGFGFGVSVDKKEIGRLMLGVRYENFLKNERIRSMVSFSQNLSKNVAGSVESGDFIQVRDMMSNMVVNRKNIAFAELMHENGTILFYTRMGMSAEKAHEMEGREERSKEGLRALRLPASRPVLIQYTTDTGGRQILDISAPVLKKDKKLGVVRIGYSLDDFLSAQKRSKQMLAGIIIAFGLIGILFSLSTSLRISHPIRTLADAAHRIGLGDLNQTVKIESGGRETRALGASFNEMIAGLRERDLVKDTFSRYVTKQVAEEILKNPDKIAPGGQKKEVTVLFADIRDFTTFSEKHPPEVVLSHLNTYLSAMVDVIFKYEGTLDKFIGDAVMAVFGSPLPHDDDPLRAVKTAIEMQARLRELNDAWKKEGKEPLNIGIGINTGEVIAGNIGDLRRMEYTVVGDNVNLASRIEGLTKNYKCPIIISSGTFEKVKERVEAKKLEAVTVKGKTKAVDIYELIDLKL